MLAQTMPLTHNLKAIDKRVWLVVLIGTSIAVGIMATDLGDFDTFYRAGAALTHGINPYTVTGFYSPLYVAAAFVPLTILPLTLAYHLYAGLVFLTYGLAFYLLTQRIGLTILFLLTPFPILTAYYGNIESWVLLGAAVNPIAGIWLVMAKPQMGLIVAALILWRAWREHSIGRALSLGLPIGIVYGLSLMAGMWQMPGAGLWRETPIANSWNISLWPIGLLIGIPAAVLALRYRKVDLALLAGPFVAPYLGNPSSWSGVFPILARKRWAAVIGLAAAWALAFIWRARI